MTGAGTIQFGMTTIRYITSFSPRRKKAAIAVYPDMSVAVTVPTGTAPDTVRDLVQKKAAWILEQSWGVRTPRHNRRQEGVCRWGDVSLPGTAVSAEDHRRRGEAICKTRGRVL